MAEEREMEKAAAAETQAETSVSLLDDIVTATKLKPAPTKGTILPRGGSKPFWDS